jgi:ribosomal protein L13E
MVSRGPRDRDRNDPKRGEDKSRQPGTQRSLVTVTLRGVARRRVGRGYSLKEINKAFEKIGIASPRIARARGLGIHVDTFRRSAYADNITSLTGVLHTLKESRKPRSSKKRPSDANPKSK